MGFRIEAPKQDGNARFNTLKVNLNENNLATRVVVVDQEGNFYYGTGGGGGTGGTNGTSGINGTNGTSGANGSSGTSGTGFNTISNPQLGRVLLSDGSTNSAIASTNLNFLNNTLQVTGSLIADSLLINSDVFEFTGSLRVLGGITGSLQGTSSWAINALTASSADSFIVRSDKFEFTGSLEVLGGITGSLLGTSSFAITASHALNVEGTASWAYNALTASSADSFIVRSDKFEFTGSLEVLGGITGSLLGTSSYALTASHALNVQGTASWAYNALTASSADDFYIRADKFEFTGSLEVLGGITGSLFGSASYALTASHALNVQGTASWAYNALTASSADDFYIRADKFEFTGSLEVSGGITGSLLGTASYAVTASHALNVVGTASWAYNALTASSADDFYIRADKFEFTGSLEVLGGITGSLLGTASYALTASHALNVVGTASWAYNALTASSADNFLVRGTLTAQTIVAQVITSSTEYVTGSTIFGSQLSNTHQFTGSVSITGSLTTDDLTVLADKFEFTGSLEVLGGITGSLYGTSSWAVSASWSPRSTQSDTASYVSSSNVYGPYGFDSIQTASFAFTASSADDFYIRADVFEFTGSLRVNGGITGSLLGTASFATTASYALNAGSAFPFSGSAVITGSLLISGSGLSTQFISNANNPLYIYTFNDPSNSTYGRLRFYYDSIQHRITSEGAGGASRDLGLMGGGAGGQLYLGTGGTNRWYITGTFNALGSGHFLPVGDNLYNIGDPTARVANYYGVGSYISNLLNVTGSANISGSVVITGSLNLNGTATVTNLVETSTKKLKENIQNYSIDLEKFKKLQPVSFNWKDTKKEDIGLIAEELEDLFPEFVFKDNTGNPVGIQYGKLATIFINVIKEQQKRIELLENQVKQLIK